MAEPFVLDTDVVSYLFRRDTRAVRFEQLLTDAVPFVSFMIIAELDHWGLNRRWGERRLAELTTFLDPYTVVMVDRSLCRLWAAITDRARRHGRPIQVADAWIAAPAVSLGIPLLTNNRADFAGVDGLKVLP